MRCDEFNYVLPEELIAQYPPESRGNSRLLYLSGESGALRDYQFNHLGELLHDGDLLIFNNTRVIPARLQGRKATGGFIEIMLERIKDSHTFQAQVKASKLPKPGTSIFIDDTYEMIIESRVDDMFMIRLCGDKDIESLLEEFGQVPLPPYIKRKVLESDQERYQTIYAKIPGAVAAPTAGLHFTEQLMSDLRTRSVDIDFITLHVGADTFKPVRSKFVEAHKMHGELIKVPDSVCHRINVAKREKRRVIAVGTTTVRALEASAEGGTIAPYYGETDIFIYPGFRFNVVDALVTNFHLPGSTLLMLVCAFAGKEKVLNAYRHAVMNGYRFFSYGDAMFLTRENLTGVSS